MCSGIENLEFHKSKLMSRLNHSKWVLRYSLGIISLRASWRCTYPVMYNEFAQRYRSCKTTPLLILTQTFTLFSRNVFTTLCFTFHTINDISLPMEAYLHDEHQLSYILFSRPVLVSDLFRAQTNRISTDWHTAKHDTKRTQQVLQKDFITQIRLEIKEVYLIVLVALLYSNIQGVTI